MVQYFFIIIAAATVYLDCVFLFCLACLSAIKMWFKIAQVNCFGMIVMLLFFPQQFLKTEEVSSLAEQFKTYEINEQWLHWYMVATNIPKARPQNN